MATRLADCSNLEQRAAIRFLQAEGLKHVKFIQECPSINLLAMNGQDGRTDTADKERGGRPADISTPKSEMIKEVKELVLADRRATIDNMAER